MNKRTLDLVLLIDLVVKLWNVFRRRKDSNETPPDVS